MKELVKIESNKNHGLVVSSRVIADQLGKEHSKVIRTIEELISEKPNVASLIIPSTYKVKGQKRGYKEYLLTKDGFTLYMFNIQGYVDFKMAYINEFNRMEQALKQPKQLQIEEPYQVVKKTLHGKPVMTIRDIVHLTGESKQAIYWNTVHRNVAYQLLEGKELEEFKKENNLKHFWNSLIVLPREGVSRLFTVLGKSQDQVEEYFGKEKPSIKDLFKVRDMEILRRLNRTLFISVEFRKQLDLLLSMEYVQLGLLEKPTTDLGVSTSAGWNLNGDVMEFYSQFM